MKRSKKKAITNRKLTIIKILPKNGTISQEDLDRWHSIFRNKLMTPEEATKTGEVIVEQIPVPKPGQHFVTIVKVGNDDYKPSVQDLEQWRQVFEDAAKDPNYMIFTHDAVNVEVIDIGNIVSVDQLST